MPLYAILGFGTIIVVPLLAIVGSAVAAAACISDTRRSTAFSLVVATTTVIWMQYLRFTWYVGHGFTGARELP